MSGRIYDGVGIIVCCGFAKTPQANSKVQNSYVGDNNDQYYTKIIIIFCRRATIHLASTRREWQTRRSNTVGALSADLARVHLFADKSRHQPSFSFFSKAYYLFVNKRRRNVAILLLQPATGRFGACGGECKCRVLAKCRGVRTAIGRCMPLMRHWRVLRGSRVLAQWCLAVSTTCQSSFSCRVSAPAGWV